MTFIWNRIKKDIEETILKEKWDLEDLKCPLHEKSLISLWISSFPSFSFSPSICTLLPSPPPPPPPCPSLPPPQPGFIKLNFDGSIKDNHGPVNYVGDFRDNSRKILIIFYGYIGINSNNATKLWALIRGLHISSVH
jgi:hypothetical protein